MRHAKAFSSMLTAVAYVLGDNSDDYFTMTEDRKILASTIEDIDPQSITPQIAATLVEFAANNGRADGCFINGSAFGHGSVIAHYTDDAAIVRFVAIK